MDDAMPGPERTRHVVASERVLTREVDGELVLLDLASEQYLGLDTVGLAMWQALTTAPSVAAVRPGLLDRFDVEPERLAPDLESFLVELERRGLVEIRAGERQPG